MQKKIVSTKFYLHDLMQGNKQNFYLTVANLTHYSMICVCAYSVKQYKTVNAIHNSWKRRPC